MIKKHEKNCKRQNYIETKNKWKRMIEIQRRNGKE